MKTAAPRADAVFMEATPIDHGTAAAFADARPDSRTRPGQVREVDRGAREPGDRSGERRNQDRVDDRVEDRVELSPEAQQLSEQDLKQVEELKQRDREVRQHEQSHLAAAGQYARGGPSFEYTTGPDGRRYVTSGHVDIDTSEVEGDPAATIRKMEVIRRAALAPADPSGQDRAVAAQASRKAQQARAELTQQPDQAAAGDARGTDEAEAEAEAEATNETSGAPSGHVEPDAERPRPRIDVLA